jgi:N-acetylmuramoyl-L-alanine amidase
MKQTLWYSLNILGLLLSLNYTSVTVAQVNPTPDPTPPSRRVLQLGNQGSSVSQIQAVLKLLGYYDREITGVYDESTQGAVSHFQEAANLTADGVFDQQSWNRLLPFEPQDTASESAPEASPVTTPTTPTTVVPTPAVPPVTTEADFPILRLGMTGEAVKQLQSRLRDLGYFGGTVDGVFGEQTLAAVKAAQTALNLTVDGIVGQGTWDGLRR